MYSYWWYVFPIVFFLRYGKLFTRKEHLSTQEQEMKLEAHQIAEMLGDIEAAEKLVENYTRMGELEDTHVRETKMLQGHFLEEWGGSDYESTSKNILYN